MASSVVVKVKYGNTLRRFSAAVNENQQMELDIEGLRAKIRSLFNFTADADLELTYLDEDEDIVALVDEEDLHDVLRQGLNPVRITVQLNTGSAASVRSSGTSTPVPAQDHNLNSNMNAGVSDLLKSVPEPLREPFSKLSAEVASKAAFSAPMIAHLIDSFTKVGQSFLNAQLPPQPANATASKEASESQKEAWPGKGASASGDERVTQGSSLDALPCLWRRSDLKRSNSVNDTCKRKFGGSSGKTTIDSAASEVKKTPFVDTNEVKFIKNSNVCPFSGLLIPPPKTSVLPKAKSCCPTEGSIFHRGVRCDGCGVLPITGPRFKSKVKEDYDLCHICFEQMGKDSDYIRIDFPAPYRHPWSCKGNPMMNARVWNHPPPPFFARHMKQFRPKLDSRFIMDVNVMDGAIMAPKTPFTKIWRMRNNGNLPWTHGTQLLWIGGDNFSLTDSVEIEVPVAGFYPENEVDVAVDFVAPELPGRYISYWKMASPSGQKFGQRFWVLIQVDASLSEMTSAVPTSLNLNLPPENLPESLDIGGVEPPLVNMEYEQSSVQDQLFNGQQDRLILPDDLLYDPIALASSSSSSAPPLPIPIPASRSISSPISYPTIEVDHVNPKPSQVEAPPQQADSKNDDVEEILLKELEEMGFKQVDINKEVLRKNEYNLDQSLDELCNVSEWDLLLEELHGMGFVDGEVNKRVLAKNNGSLKHAVMDLITRENV